MRNKDIATIRLVICVTVVVIVILSIYSSLSSKAKINELVQTVQSLQNAIEIETDNTHDVVGDVEIAQDKSDEPMRSIAAIQDKLDGLEAKIDDIGSFEGVETALAELIRVIAALQGKIEDMYAKIMSTAKSDPVSSPSPPQTQSVELNTPVQTQSNKTINVTITAPQVEDMYGYEFKIYFNKEIAEYTGDLESNISSISTIFDRDFDSYILVGATMIGDVKGYSGNKPEICTLSFAVSQEIDVSAFRIDDVSMVKSDLEYVKNITDWSISATVSEK